MSSLQANFDGMTRCLSLTDTHAADSKATHNVQPDWLILNTAEEVTRNETSGTFHEFFPGHFVIGSNGGGEAVALMVNKDGQGKVVYFDMTNIDLEESVVALAPSFNDPISLLEDYEG